MVDGILDDHWLPRFRQIDMDDLPGRVDPGVGTASAHHGDVVPGQGLERLLEPALDCFDIVLTLEARKRAAMIFDSQPVAGQ